MSERMKSRETVDFNPKKTFLDRRSGREFDILINKQEYKERRRRRLGITGLVLSGLTLLGANDIYQNYEIAQEATIDITAMGDALDPQNNDVGLFFFNGFNSFDADPIVDSIGPAVQQAIDGQMLSIGYNNATLNIDSFAEEVEDYSVKHHIKKAVIVTYSMGCVMGTMTAEKITENPDVDLSIEAFVYVSCPSDYSALRDRTQGEVDFLRTVSPIPFVEYSTPIRLGGEIYFERDRYTKGSLTENVVNFGKTVVNAYNVVVSNKKATTIGTIFDQGLIIDDANFDERLNNIAHNTASSLQPAVFYFGTGEVQAEAESQQVCEVKEAESSSGWDYVLDDKESAYNMCEDAGHAGLPYLDEYVPGAIHSRPDLTKEEYAAKFAEAKDAIQSILDRQESFIGLQNNIRTPVFGHK